MRVPLSRIAHARSGDKGDISNVGILANEERYYALLLREVTAERVKQHFGSIVLGAVTRFEMPNIEALNFVMERALDGGGTISLRTDAQGKTHAAALLTMEIEVGTNELAS